MYCRNLDLVSVCLSGFRISGEIISFKYLNYFEGGGRESFSISRTRRETMEDIQKNQVGMALFLSAYMHQGDDLFSAESRGKHPGENLFMKS